MGEYTVTKHVYVAPTDEEAQAEARGPQQWFLDAYRRSMQADQWPDLHPSVYAQVEKANETIASLRWEELVQDALLFGSPETVSEKVRALEAAGVGELGCWTSFGGLPPDKVRRSMQLFADEVMPAFHAAPAAQRV